MGLIAAAGIGAVGAIGGAVISGSAAKSAADDQVQGEEYAANIQQQMYEQTAARLQPFTQAGVTATGELAGTPNFNFNPTQSWLEQTPGYQFNLAQGEKAVQNSAAARGLGTSGAALKGAAGYASGLASNQYQNMFANSLATYNTNLARLQNLSGVGESAAAQTGAFGTQTAANIGQTAVGAANAEAAGTIGVANAVTGGINTLSQLPLQYYMLNQFNGGGGGASIYTMGQ